MAFYIGIDAGGTKTTAAIVNDEKEILFEAHAGFGNPNIHLDQALQHIWETLTACLETTYGQQCETIVMGVSGIETGDNRLKFQQFFQDKVNKRVIIVNDAVLAYHALLDAQDGILTIAGTGSISFGKKGTNSGYSGGWGHILGDQGSSYDIAIQAFRYITVEADMGISHSPVSRILMKEIGAKKAEDIKQFIYQATKGEIAAFTYLIYLEAKKGNEKAIQYFHDAGEKLAKQTWSLFSKLQLQTPLLVGCKGSLLEKNEFVQNQFQSSLETYIGDIQIIMDKRSPAIGAKTVASLYPSLIEPNH